MFRYCTLLLATGALSLLPGGFTVLVVGPPAL